MMVCWRLTNNAFRVKHADTGYFKNINNETHGQKKQSGNLTGEGRKKKHARPKSKRR